jgi:hypothetical protein
MGIWQCTDQIKISISDNKFMMENEFDGSSTTLSYSPYGNVGIIFTDGSLDAPFFPFPSFAGVSLILRTENEMQIPTYCETETALTCFRTP